MIDDEEELLFIYISSKKKVKYIYDVVDRRRFFTIQSLKKIDAVAIE